MKYVLSFIVAFCCTGFAQEQNPLNGLTLVSGFSQFNGSQQSPTVSSDLGTESLEWTLKNVVWNDVGMFTTLTDVMQPVYNIASLNLTAKSESGYTVSLTFAGIQNPASSHYIFSIVPQDNATGTLKTRRIAIRPDGHVRISGGSSAFDTDNSIDFTMPFSLTVSVQAGGKYTLFMTQNNTTYSTPSFTETYIKDSMDFGLLGLCFGSNTDLTSNQSRVTVSGASFWQGAATAEQIPFIIAASAPVPEPSGLLLTALSLGCAGIYRKRPVTLPERS